MGNNNNNDRQSSCSYNNNNYSYNQSRQDSYAPRGFRMIISGFDANTHRSDIAMFAGQAGKTVSILNIYDYKNSKHAIASYQSKTEFEYAVKNLDGAKLNGVKVRCYNERDPTPPPSEREREKMKKYKSSKERERSL